MIKVAIQMSREKKNVNNIGGTDHPFGISKNKTTKPDPELNCYTKINSREVKDLNEAMKP